MSKKNTENHQDQTERESAFPEVDGETKYVSPFFIVLTGFIAAALVIIRWVKHQARRLTPNE